MKEYLLQYNNFGFLKVFRRGNGYSSATNVVLVPVLVLEIVVVIRFSIP